MFVLVKTERSAALKGSKTSKGQYFLDLLVHSDKLRCSA
jgi:hypothetical protein